MEIQILAFVTLYNMFILVEWFSSPDLSTFGAMKNNVFWCDNDLIMNNNKKKTQSIRHRYQIPPAKWFFSTSQENR